MDHPMIYGEPLSFSEIAKREGLTLEQVKWEYRKGMTKLKHRPGLLQQMCRLAAELHPGSYSVAGYSADALTPASDLVGGSGPYRTVLT